MQEIVEGLYNSTPGLNEEMPRQESKILGVKYNKTGASSNDVAKTLTWTEKASKKQPDWKWDYHQ